jgi:pimeloyl-ACP methyl ester carboxylesterase
VLASCAAIPSATDPLERIEYPSRPGKKADTLIVMIHGRGDGPDSFAERGFVDELTARGALVDVVAVDAHVAYFMNRSFGQRLHDDVIAPKRLEGYRRIYLAGVSRGGLGALVFARRYAGEPDGIILFAPFLGPELFAKEIAAQGGLATWKPNPPIEDIEDVWLWLQGYATGAPRPRIELLWGEQDAFLPQITILDDVLPVDQTFSIPGGHDWETWRKLWAELLDRDPFGLVRTPEVEP